MQVYLKAKHDFTAYTPYYVCDIQYRRDELFTLGEVARHEIPLENLEIAVIEQPHLIRKYSEDLPLDAMGLRRQVRWIKCL